MNGTRCDWLFNDRGYQCSQQAVWRSPMLSPEGVLNHWCLCDIHKLEAQKLIAHTLNHLAGHLPKPPAEFVAKWEKITG